MVIGDGTAFGGAMAQWAGLSAWKAGRHDEAIALLQQGIALNRRLGAVPFLRRAEADLAAVVADEDRARTKEPQRETSKARLCRRGDVWEVALGDQRALLKDTKGLGYLATLLAQPGREVHVLDLASPGHPRERALDAGPVLDAQARRSYIERLEELRIEADEARDYNDSERLSLAEAEMDLLASQLTGATALHGRSRRAASVSETRPFQRDQGTPRRRRPHRRAGARAGSSSRVFHPNGHVLLLHARPLDAHHLEPLTARHDGKREFTPFLTSSKERA